MSDVLSQALSFTLGNEGGYVNHPADPGGATNHGIIQRNLDRWNGAHPELGFPGDVKDLTQDQAKTIYRANYWRWDGIAAPAIAIKLFDIGVNCGTGTAVKLLQRALNTMGAVIELDGHIGPATIAATNIQDPTAMMKAICGAQADYYRAIVNSNPSQSVFLRGWLNRAARTPEAL